MFLAQRIHTHLVILEGCAAGTLLAITLASYRIEKHPILENRRKIQEPLHAPFLNELFSRGFSSP